MAQVPSVDGKLPVKEVVSITEANVSESSSAPINLFYESQKLQSGVTVKGTSDMQCTKKCESVNEYNVTSSTSIEPSFSGAACALDPSSVLQHRVFAQGMHSGQLIEATTIQSDPSIFPSISATSVEVPSISTTSVEVNKDVNQTGLENFAEKFMLSKSTSLFGGQEKSEVVTRLSGKLANAAVSLEQIKKDDDFSASFIEALSSVAQSLRIDEFLVSECHVSCQNPSSEKKIVKPQSSPLQKTRKRKKSSSKKIRRRHNSGIWKTGKRNSFKQKTKQNSPGAMQKTSKRRFTFGGHQHLRKPYGKRRRTNSVALPTRFLLGGNINDPLNLKSLENEEVNRRLNALTPKTSPLPLSQHRMPIEVFIPHNIHDPLNLNTGEDIELSCISPVRKRKRHRRHCGKKEQVGVQKKFCCGKAGREFFLKESEAGSSSACTVQTESSEPTSSKSFQTLLAATEELSDTEMPSTTACSTYEHENVSVCRTNLLLDLNRDTCSTEKPAEQRPDTHNVTCDCWLFEKALRTPLNKTMERSKSDKIVSPVVPQGDARSRWGRRNRAMKRQISFRKSARRLQIKTRPTVTNVEDVDMKFRCGTIPHQYVCSKDENPRFQYFCKDLFSGKEILDVGCNIGCISMLIAEHFQPKRVVGIDIDADVILRASRHAAQHLNSSVESDESIPTLMGDCYGTLIKMALPEATENSRPPFLSNVSFHECDYVNKRRENIFDRKPAYDVILCLRVTKYIHLNYGDEGMKRAFKRMFAELRGGGCLILEPQPWFSYSKHKWSPHTIELKPEEFPSYLLSVVGFDTCKVLSRYVDKNGYRQTVYHLTKPDSSSSTGDAHQSGLILSV